MPWTVTIAGVDRTSFVLDGTVDINSDIVDRANAGFETFDKTGQYVAKRGEEVIIVDDNGARVFGGIVDDLNKDYIRQADGTLGVQAQVEAVAFDFPDRRLVVAIFDDFDVYDIVQAVVDTELAPDEVRGGLKDHYRLDGGVSHWRLGESSGTNAADEIASNDGIYIGSPTLGVAGLLDQDTDTAVTFDGTDDNVFVTFAAALNAAEFSIEAWANPDVLGAGTDRVIYDSRGPSSTGFVLFLNSSDEWEFEVFDGATSVSVTIAATHDVTQHLVGTYDGTDARLYLDGVLAAGPTSVTLDPNPSTEQRIGVANSSGGASDFFEGTIDEVAVYSDDLAASVIATHNRVGVDSPLQSGFFINKLVSNYRFAGEVFDDLSSVTGMDWYIDPFNQLLFRQRQANPAPLSIERDATGDAFTTTLKFNRLTVSGNRDAYRNRQFVRAGAARTDPLVEIFRGERDQSTWVVGFPIAEEPTILFNGSPATVGIRGLEDGFDYYWNRDDSTITKDDTTTAFKTSDVLTVTYIGLFPIILLTEDGDAIAERQSVEGGSGVYEHLQDEPQIDTEDMAIERGDGLLRRYARLPDVLTVTTSESTEPRAGEITAGMLLPVVIPEADINASYLVQRVGVSDDNSEFRYTWSLIGGEHVGSWTDFFRRLALRSRDDPSDTNEVLLLLQRTTDTVAFQDSIVVTDTAIVCYEVDVAEVSFAEAC